MAYPEFSQPITRLPKGSRINRRNWCLLLAVPALLPTVARSEKPDRPTDEEVRQDLVKEIKYKAKGLTKLGDFTKINGMELESSGAKAHSVEWKAMLHFTADSAWNPKTLAAEPAIPELDTSSQSGRILVKEGQTVEVIGRTDFRKMDKGWTSTRFVTLSTHIVRKKK